MTPSWLASMLLVQLTGVWQPLWSACQTCVVICINQPERKSRKTMSVVKLPCTKHCAV